MGRTLFHPDKVIAATKAAMSTAPPVQISRPNPNTSAIQPPRTGMTYRGNSSVPTKGKRNGQAEDASH